MRKAFLTASVLLAILPAQVAAQEIIMRRPLPNLGGSGPAVDPEIPVDPDDPFDPSDPDLDPIEEGAWYYAYAQCNGTTIDVSCTEMTYGDGWEMNFTEGASLSACRQQDPSDFDYQWAAQIGDRPEGSILVHPANISSTQGASCDEMDVEIVEHIAVYCGEWRGQIEAYCESNTFQIHNGQTTFIGWDEPDESACTQDASYIDRPGYQEFLDEYGYSPAGPEGLGICGESTGPIEEEGFYVDDGQCTYETTSNTDGSTTIDYFYEWNCRKVTNFEVVDFSGDTFPVYNLNTVAASNCENADQSAEDRATISQYFTPQYNDPQSVDTNCEGKVEVVRDWRVEVSPTPQVHFDQFGNNLEKNGIGLGSYNPTAVYVEEYTYYCHRYDESIFALMMVDPDVVNDSRYVKDDQ